MLGVGRKGPWGSASFCARVSAASVNNGEMGGARFPTDKTGSFGSGSAHPLMIMSICVSEPTLELSGRNQSKLDL